MWGNFVPDLGKLGEQLTAAAGEALQKATADVEKSIDSRLGIKGGLGAKAAAGNVAVEAQAPAASGLSDGSGSASADPATPIAAPGAKPGQKKVVKKIIRRVVKGSSAEPAAAAAAAGGGATAVSSNATTPRNPAEEGNAFPTSSAGPCITDTRTAMPPGHSDRTGPGATTYEGPGSASPASSPPARLNGAHQEAAAGLEPKPKLKSKSSAPVESGVTSTPAPEPSATGSSGSGGHLANGVTPPAASPSSLSSLSPAAGAAAGAAGAAAAVPAVAQRIFGETDTAAEPRGQPPPPQSPSRRHQEQQQQQQQDGGAQELMASSFEASASVSEAVAAAGGAGRAADFGDGGDADADATAAEPSAAMAGGPVPAGGWDDAGWPDEDLEDILAGQAPGASGGGGDTAAAASDGEKAAVSSSSPGADGPAAAVAAAGAGAASGVAGTVSVDQQQPHNQRRQAVSIAAGSGAGADPDPGPGLNPAAAKGNEGGEEAAPSTAAVDGEVPSASTAAAGKLVKQISRLGGKLELGAKDAAAAAAGEGGSSSPPSPWAQAPAVNGGCSADGGSSSSSAAAAAAAAAAASREREELEELRRTVAKLQSELRERDTQLHVQAVRMSDMQQVVSGLQTRNEELALRSAGLSEADFEAVRTEFEQRLAAAERKVYALTKERDALRKGSEKLADYGALVKEKDDIIKQVMDEGEKLSKKQVELEGIIKRLRGQLSATEGERDKVAGRLAAEEAAVGELKRVRAKLEKDLLAAAEQSKADLEAQKEHFEMLLNKARSDQVDAEERARDAAAAGLGRKLPHPNPQTVDSNLFCFYVSPRQNTQLPPSLLLHNRRLADISDLERRCQAAELRHQDLAAKVPEATRPLLRQIEAMQAAMEAQAEAWAGAEAALQARLSDAEGRGAAAAERERLAVDKMHVLSNKVAGLEASLSASRSEVRQLNEALEGARGALASSRSSAAAAAHQSEVLGERCRLQEQQLEQLETALREHRDTERAARAAAEYDIASLRREYERRLAEAEGELTALRTQAQAEAMKRPEPPAMAAPGYRWVLVKEGEQPPQPPQPDPRGGGVSSTPSYTASSGRSASSSATATAAATSGTMGLSDLTLGAGSGSGGGGGGGGIHVVMASELESLRGALRAKTGELVAAQQLVGELEATRDRLAEELVAGSARSEAAAEALQERDQLREELAEMRVRLNNALELVGERDEQVEELLADLQDVKCMYKDQIEFMCQQLLELQGPRHTAGATATAPGGSAAALQGVHRRVEGKGTGALEKASCAVLADQMERGEKVVGFTETVN
ncbi:hypothetical protein VOLCADRAFT_90809 [Volvox carteri f. nagariensis]|uniref:TATA element modulatory factor 1 TATA binding domain-containing protein n=1 Tax=Volvox carteri f. nagariensis TaxID=3068 RepID=D8TV40_VOLCA|nr:uncharacterized protein VOLCADRAFT_90809 [Volvox carteri f. nagariensis]EFJ48636.1 hypothetical protein VOLCADRAFT_90809 [Volvox carteri f. nagariensis]|eukprot:XP_002950435.1 hypothetical protein VOLCADRAFT_90809 [Volvox carteri f. nagariensis]